MTIPKAFLKFSPYAWAKMQYMLRAGDTEVGMMGITTLEDPLKIYDVVVLPQESTGASFEFTKEGIANFYEDCIDCGLKPIQYSRVWIHTHPSGVHGPSSTDEKNFSEIFGNCDWAVMYILAKDNVDYCALQFNNMPAHRVELTGSRVDFLIPFPASNVLEWEKEYKENVKKKVFEYKKNKNDKVICRLDPTGYKPKEIFKSLNKIQDIEEGLMDYSEDDLFFEDDWWDANFYKGSYK